MEVSRFSSSTESSPYTMCCEGDAHCDVWHWWSNTTPRCTSKTVGKRCLLLHVIATTPSSSTQEKTTTLGGTEPHHSSWQCKESHSCCHGSLAPLEMADSGVSSILTQYESMRLRSFRQSERTTVYTFIPLRDKTINPVLGRARVLTIKPVLYSVSHVFVRCITMSTNVFLQLSKNVNIAWKEVCV